MNNMVTFNSNSCGNGVGGSLRFSKGQELLVSIPKVLLLEYISGLPALSLHDGASATDPKGNAKAIPKGTSSLHLSPLTFPK